MTDDRTMIDRLESTLSEGLGLLRCHSTTGNPNPGPDSDFHYCTKMWGHEILGIDHQSEDGTTW